MINSCDGHKICKNFLMRTFPINRTCGYLTTVFTQIKLTLNAQIFKYGNTLYVQVD